MAFQARNNNVILLLDDKEERVTAGGIVLSQAHAAPPDFGKVVSKGEGRYTLQGELIPILCEEGDVVYFDKMPPTKGITLEGVEYVLVDGDSILAIKEKA